MMTIFDAPFLIHTPHRPHLPPSTVHRPHSPSIQNDITGASTATAMEPESKQLCVCCGNAAASKCSRCKAAVYCNAACQQANWREHKKTCNHPNLDCTVQRAGALLQKLFFIWHENTLAEEFDEIEENEKRTIYTFM